MSPFVGRQECPPYLHHHDVVSRKHSSRLETLLLIAILVVATWLRAYNLDGSSLWSDEGNTWALLSRSFGQIARDAAADIHPPGYYWLLKVWTSIFGTSVNGMRSFSVLAGVAVVFVVYGIGKRLDAYESARISWLALLAALLAALNPLQIYYGQEARMYILLALAGTGLFWALLGLVAQDDILRTVPQESPAPEGRHATRQPNRIAYSILYILCGTIGLWTHYSFPILLTAAALTHLYHWLQPHSTPHHLITSSPFHPFTLNAIILLTYLPWLPTAIDRVLAWPRKEAATSLAEGAQLTLQTLTFGPLDSIAQPLWPWLLTAGILPLIGLAALKRHIHVVALALWLGLPIALMFGLNLFSDAFLKFLLAAAPAWCLLSAAVPGVMRWRAMPRIAIAIGAIALAWATLPRYYTDPVARDNYAGVARYIAALGKPEDALVILDAPGQQEVWDFYNPGFATLALPQQRPPNAQQTRDTLAAAVAERNQIFALFWATDEADPDRLVERWLDQHAFKGLVSWQGNMRFVTYSLPNRLVCDARAPSATFGDHIVLRAQCQPEQPQNVTAGDVVLLGLHWATTAPLDARYKVTIQLLDARNQVIAQRDSEPAGGSLPTDGWQPGQLVEDNHSIAIPPGTPPGMYRLIVALYDYDTFQRLPTSSGDFMEMGTVIIHRPERALPLEVVDMMWRANAVLDGVTLVGYDRHRKGSDHATETPIQAGDLVHVTLYWQAPDILDSWPDDLHFTLRLGEQTLTAPLAGGGYPTAEWQAGEFVRGEFDILFDGTNDTPIVTINEHAVRLTKLPR